MVDISFIAEESKGSLISFHKVPKEEMQRVGKLLGVKILPLSENDPKGTQTLTFEICKAEITLFSKRK